MVDERHDAEIRLTYTERGLAGATKGVQAFNAAYTGAAATGAKLNSALSKSESRFKMIGQQAFTTGVAFYGVNVIVSTLIGGIGALGGEIFALDTNMRSIQIASGRTEDQISSLTNEMIDSTLAGDTYGNMLGESSAALYEIEQAGFHGSAGLDVLNQSQANATAGQSELIASSRLLTAILNAYSGTGITTRQVSDSLFQTILDGVITFDQLSQHMGQVIPTAAAVGVSIQEIGAAVSVLTQRGQEPAQALTAMNQFLTAFLKPSAQAAELAGTLGLQFNAAHLGAVGLSAALEEILVATKGDETALTTLFGNVRALRAIFPLAEDGGALFNKMLVNQGLAGEGAGIAAESLSIREKSLSVQFHEAWAQASALITGGLLPMAQAFLGPVAAGAVGFLSLAGPVIVQIARFEELFLVAGLAATAFGVKLLAVKFGTFISNTQAFMAVFQPLKLATLQATAATDLYAANVMKEYKALKAAEDAAKSLAVAEAYLAEQKAVSAAASVVEAAAVNASTTAAVANVTAQDLLINDALRVVSATRGTGKEYEKLILTETVATATTTTLAASSTVLTRALTVLRAAVIRLWASMWPFLAAAGAAIIAWTALKAGMDDGTRSSHQAADATEHLKEVMQGLTREQIESEEHFRIRSINAAIEATRMYAQSLIELGVVLDSTGRAAAGNWMGGVADTNEIDKAISAHAKAVANTTATYSELAGTVSNEFLAAVAREAHELGALDKFLGDSNSAWAENQREIYGTVDAVDTFVRSVWGSKRAIEETGTAAEDTEAKIKGMFEDPTGAEASITAAVEKAKYDLMKLELIARPSSAERKQMTSLDEFIFQGQRQVDVLAQGRRAGAAGEQAGELGGSVDTGFFTDLPGISAGQMAGLGTTIKINSITINPQNASREEIEKLLTEAVMEEVMQNMANRLNTVIPNMVTGEGRGHR